jgi:hypothetical protein
VFYSKLDLSGFDHLFAVGQRYFHHLDYRIGQSLTKRFYGAVTQVTDGPSLPGVVDCSFNVARGPQQRNNLYVGWAADPEVFSPTQDARTLTILVDHANYSSGGDWSREIDNEVVAFVGSSLWRKRYERVRVRRLIDGGAMDWRNGVIPEFTRKHIPITKIAKEYGEAHIFLGTHQESLGWVNIEMAMSGALPVLRQGAIPEDRTKEIGCITYQGRIPWDKVIERADPISVRGEALFDKAGQPRNRWSQIAQTILAYYERFGRKPPK